MWSHARAAAHKPDCHHGWSGVTHHSWILEQRKCVLWTDESHFTIWQSDWRTLVLVDIWKRYLPE